MQARRPRPFALRDDLLALTPKRAVALRHEGEWSTHSTALQGGPGAAGMRRRARAHRVSKMLLYVETWLPLLSVALTSAILCGLVSFMMGRAQR